MNSSESNNGSELPASDSELVDVRKRTHVNEKRFKLKSLFPHVPRRGSHDTREEHSTTELEDEMAPRDHNHLVYVCMVMAGMGFLIPWTCFVGALDYFFYYYMLDFPSVSIAIPVGYLITTFFAASVNLVLVKLVPIHSRITFGYIMFIISLLMIPLLDIGIHSCTVSSKVTFYLTLFSVGLVGLGSGIQQSSFYGLSSMMPRKYTQAVMAGESVAGVLEISFRIATKAAVKSERVGAFLFFGLSLCLIIVCVFCHCYIRNNKMVRYYTRQCRRKPEEQLGVTNEITSVSEENLDQQLLITESDEVEMDDLNITSARSKPGGKNGVTGSKYYKSPNSVCTQPRRSPALENFKVLGSVIVQIWLLIGAIFINYFVTLLLFPGLLLKVQNCMLGSWTPVFLVAIFNYVDFVAKWLALLPVMWSPKQLLVGSSCRILLIPLVILCVSPSPSHPILGSNVVLWAGLFTFLLALSNGYFGSLPLIIVSAHVKVKNNRELAGTVMTWALLLGLLLGAVFAYGLSPLTTIQEYMLCTNEYDNTTINYFNLCDHGNATKVL